MIKSRRRCARHVACMGDRKGECRILVGRAHGKRTLGRPRRKWENIKFIFKKWGREVWTGLLWLRTRTGSARL
jgi:hypothetical protein